MLRVIDVHCNHLAEACLILAINLPVSGKPGRRIDALLLRWQIALKFVRSAWARADKAHFAADDVEESAVVHPNPSARRMRAAADKAGIIAAIKLRHRAVGSA